jgi:hypothetical protein
MSAPGYVGPTIKVYAPNAVTITSATVPFASDRAFNDLGITIYNDASGTPGTALSGQLTHQSYLNLVETLTGTIAIPSAGYYWIQLNASNGGDYNCFTNTVNYTGSAAGWVVYAGLKYGTSGTGNVATAWANFGVQYNYQMNFTLYSSAPIVGTVTLVPSSYSATYRSSIALSATTSASGFVTFYANGKIIPGCKRIAVPSNTATCNWKPSQKNSIPVYATFVPSGGIAGSSSVVRISVDKRTGKR